MKSVQLSIKLIVLVSVLGACSPAGAGAPVLRGKVVDAESGQPLGRISVGAVAAASLRNLADGESVRPQVRTLTNNFGEFELRIPREAGNAARMIVFTADPLYGNRACGGVELASQLPTVQELRRAAPINAYRPQSLTFELSLAVRVMEKVMAPMRDGVELAATVYLPAEEGEYPAVLLRTPYGRKASERFAVLAREGYAFVAQDQRGRGDSEGENVAFLPDGWGELQDGYDTVQWVAGQEWCNGRVGTIGGSAMGIAQNLMAGAAPPALKAQVIMVAATSLYHDAVYPGGVLRKSQVERWLSGNEWDERCLDLMLAHPLYDDFWRGLNLEEREDVAFPPVMYIGGWFDTFAEGTIRGYDLRRHHARSGSPEDTYLVMGPWSHGTLFEAAAGEVRFPLQAEMPFVDDAIAFFDRYLKGEDNAFSGDYPRVQYFVMGALAERGAPGNFWVQASDYPPSGDEGVLFLAPNGRLLGGLPDRESHSVEFTFSPQNPVPTRGGRNLHLPAGPADQREVEQRTDVISFTTDRLTSPLPFAGAVRAQLHLAVDAPDADVSVRLTDVYPDGTSFLLLDASARMSLPPPYERKRSLAQGKYYAVVVELGNIAYIVNKGHRLRVALAASNYPRFGLNARASPDGPPVRLRVSLGRDKPSSLVFNVCEELLRDG